MADFADLAEHSGALVGLIVFLVAVCGSLITIVYRVMMQLKVDILTMIGKLDDRLGAVWTELNDIRKRQETLREQLPKEYLRIDGPGYRLLAEGIQRIEKRLEDFIEDWLPGK